MIKNIVFDIGNVLTDFRWEEFLHDKGFDDEMIKRIAKASVETDYWHEFDRGELSFEDCLNGFIETDPGIEAQLHQAFDDVTGIVTGRDYAIPWIKQLQSAGYKVYFLSNFSEKAAIECADALRFMDICDGGILSYREKIIKPDHRIYELLCERYSLEPNECVFIDDLERNVNAAKECGFSSFVFKDQAQANEELRALGVGI